MSNIIINNKEIELTLNTVLKYTKPALNDTVVNKIAEYIYLLFNWHETKNILATKNVEYFIKREVYDCLAASNFLPKGNVLDVGTGGGLPGLLIALANKKLNMFLLDKKEMANRFLVLVKKKLKITNIDVIHSSIEKMDKLDNLKAVIFKNFTNKNISKLTYEKKIEYLVEILRNKFGTNLPVYFLTGSKSLKLLKQVNDSNYNVSEIKSPFFSNSRFLLGCTT